MGRATMYQEPLEVYVLSKIRAAYPGAAETVRVRRIDGDGCGCSWEVEAIEPSLPIELATDIERLIILPLQETIDLVK
jgi:hypothetical protein